MQGVGEFYDTVTSERFVPRGMNYHPWTDDIGGGYGALLTVDHYDSGVIEADLAAIAGYGFNTVRIFLDTCHPASGCVGTGPSGTEVNEGFIDNLADFLRIADDHGMVVLVSSNTLLDDSWWLHQTAGLQDAQFESANNEFLNPEASLSTSINGVKSWRGSWNATPPRTSWGMSSVRSTISKTTLPPSPSPKIW